MLVDKSYKQTDLGLETFAGHMQFDSFVELMCMCRDIHDQGQIYYVYSQLLFFVIEQYNQELKSVEGEQYITRKFVQSVLNCSDEVDSLIDNVEEKTHFFAGPRH